MLYLSHCCLNASDGARIEPALTSANFTITFHKAQVVLASSSLRLVTTIALQDGGCRPTNAWNHYFGARLLHGSCGFGAEVTGPTIVEKVLSPTTNSIQDHGVIGWVSATSR